MSLLVGIHILLMNVSAANPIDNSLQTVESLKSDMVSISRDLTLLKEELYYPQSQQVSLYLSVKIHDDFTLSAIKVLIDGEVVLRNKYSSEQQKAFKLGGIKRIYQGNVSAGKHIITAFITGTNSLGEQNKRGVIGHFIKEDITKSISLSFESTAPTEQISLKLAEH